MKPRNSITMGDKTVTRIASLTTLRLDGRTNQQKKKNRQTKTLPTLLFFFFLLDSILMDAV
jgi:hypothetical protein